MYTQPVRILREPIGIADEYHQKSVLIKSVLSVRFLEMSCVHPFLIFTQNPSKTGFCFFFLVSWKVGSVQIIGKIRS